MNCFSLGYHGQWYCSWTLIFEIGSWAQANYCNQELCQESVIDLLGFRLVGGRVIALNVTYILPLPKKIHIHETTQAFNFD